MNYKLIKSSSDDIEKLIEYKKKTIYEYAKDLSDKEINEIDNYARNTVLETINDYMNIVIDNKVVGCLLLTKKDDGILIDEIYLEKEYRNKSIGTNIINNILKDNDIVYLWVYKENIKAIELYKRLEFKIIDETDSRYYMKYSK